MILAHYFISRRVFGQSSFQKPSSTRQQTNFMTSFNNINTIDQSSSLEDSLLAIQDSIETTIAYLGSDAACNETARSKLQPAIANTRLLHAKMLSIKARMLKTLMLTERDPTFQQGGVNKLEGARLAF